MAKTVAAVDIGTNSVKMTVGTYADGRLDVKADETRITRLGKGVDHAGRLDPDAMAKTLAALAEFAGQAGSLGAERIAAVGTSALRDAANGAEFVTAARETLGGEVEVIAGIREAQLIYQAMSRDPDLALSQVGLLAMTDIGGGSTEVVEGRDGVVVYQNSLQLGAVRLTERALRTDPPAPTEVQSAIEIADSLLADVPTPLSGDIAVTMAASGGTIANLAAMTQCARTGEPCDFASLHGMRLTLVEIETWIDNLSRRTVAERRGIPGLEPDRADVILAGAIVQARAMRRLGVEEVTVSLRGLRYGLLYELAEL